jgi:TatD DNase family protein
MIDTHTHLYLDAFENDLPEVLQQAQEAGIDEMWLPAIDAHTVDQLEAFRGDPRFRLFAGLHPCEVGSNVEAQLNEIRERLDKHAYDGIGEIGLDLYWDQTYLDEQRQAFHTQLRWALERHQPALIHVRDAFEEALEVVRPFYGSGLKAVFHSFAGNLEQALELVGEGFYLGINGTITFKNAQQPLFLHQVPLTAILTETDAPYLSPVPLRGKRNQPSFMVHTVEKLAAIYQLPRPAIEAQTRANAQRLLQP